MTIIFCDTETVGLDLRDSLPYELAFLAYQNGKRIAEEVYHLNCLAYPEIVVHADALKVNGATEEQIRAYPAPGGVVKGIADFFKKYCPPEKLYFAGYNAGFDFGMVISLLKHEGLNMDDYFNRKLIDVLALVKKAAAMGLLPKTENKKLETMTKALGIEHEGAHGALSDIRATRILYETIYMMERSKRR
jgi:DNA polymerase III epsilon subunit-like protein